MLQIKEKLKKSKNFKKGARSLAHPSLFVVNDLSYSVAFSQSTPCGGDANERHKTHCFGYVLKIPINFCHTSSPHLPPILLRNALSGTAQFCGTAQFLFVYYYIAQLKNPQIALTYPQICDIMLG